MYTVFQVIKLFQLLLLFYINEIQIKVRLMLTLVSLDFHDPNKALLFVLSNDVCSAPQDGELGYLQFLCTEQSHAINIPTGYM